MSTANVENKVAALFTAARAAYTSADANTGEGMQGEWPPQGDHDLFVLAAHEKEGEFKPKTGNAVACIEIAFEYEWIRDEKDPTFDREAPPMIFRGERFQLVPSFETAITDEGSRTRARMNWDRFKGHLSKILRKSKDQCTDPLADYKLVKERIASPSRLAVSAKIQYRQSKDGKTTYKTEFISDNITR